MTPSVVIRLIEDRHSVTIQSGAGRAAGFMDEQYRQAGADGRRPLSGCRTGRSGWPTHTRAGCEGSGAGDPGRLSRSLRCRRPRQSPDRPPHHLFRHGSHTQDHSGPEHGRALLTGHRSGLSRSAAGCGSDAEVLPDAHGMPILKRGPRRKCDRRQAESLLGFRRDRQPAVLHGQHHDVPRRRQGGRGIISGGLAGLVGHLLSSSAI